MNTDKPTIKICPANGSKCGKACPNYKGSRNCNLFNLSQQYPDALDEVLLAGEISSQQHESYLPAHISLKIHANGFAKAKIKALKSSMAGNTQTFDVVEEFLLQSQHDFCEDVADLPCEQQRPQTSFDQIRESASRLYTNLVCIGFVIIVILLIIGRFAS